MGAQQSLPQMEVAMGGKNILTSIPNPQPYNTDSQPIGKQMIPEERFELKAKDRIIGWCNVK